MDFFKNVFNFFAGSRLLWVTVFFSLLVIVVGSSFEQGLTAARYEGLYGFGGQLILFFELDNVYHSWLLLVCGLILWASLLAGLITAAYQKKWSLTVFKLSLLLIITGGYLESSYGQKGYMHLSRENYSSYMPLSLQYGLNQQIRLPFALKSSSFSIISGTDGRPLAYQSTLEILYKGQRFSHELQLGEPLTLGGYNISQASYYPCGPEQLCAIVEVANHPGKYCLALGGLLLLLSLLPKAIAAVRK